LLAERVVLASIDLSGEATVKLDARLVVIPTVLALAGAPALAVAAPPSDHPTGPPSTAATGKPSDTPSGKPVGPGPKASLPAKAKAYGAYCKSESKRHVSGQKGTPFSQCVTAMAKLTTGQTISARTACKGESKKHVSGQKGTPFSQCVSAAAKLEAHESSGSGDDTSGDDGGSTSSS
jgi:hypothetical protein